MSLSKLEQKIKNGQEWFKLAAAINELFEECLLPIVHRDGAAYQAIVYTGLPKDETLLFTTLSDIQHKSKLDKLRNSNILKQDQYDLLFPSNGKTDSSKFDITLLGLLFRTFSGLITLNGMWRIDLIDPADISLASFVVKLLDLRNRLFHWGNIEVMSKVDSNKFWSDAVSIALGLQYVNDIKRFQNITLDPDNVLANRIWQQKLQFDVDQLGKEHEDLKAKQGSLETKHDKMETRYEELETTQEHLETKQEVMEKKQEDLETNHEYLNTKQEKLETKQDDLEMKQDDLETKQEDLETKQEDLETREEDLETKHDKMEIRYEELETKQEHLEAKQEVMEKNQEDLEKTHEYLNTKQEKLETKQYGLETKHNDLETSQDNLQTKQKNLETKQEDTEKNQEDLKTKQEDLESKQGGLKTKQEDLETKYDQLKIEHNDLKKVNNLTNDAPEPSKSGKLN